MIISNFKLGIGVPANFPMLPSGFFDSFILMEKPDFVYLRSTRANIENMRNEIVAEALKSRCTHLLMMDSDQIYDPQTITRLLSHKLPVVGCLVYRRYPPFDPLMLKGTIGGYSTISEWEPDSLVEVDATGTGCIMFETEVFRVLPYPWFRFRQGPYGAPVGEDFGFCYDLKEKGYNIFVDTSIVAGHLSQMVINDGTWKLYRRMKEAEKKASEKSQ
jgi:hypothetical protein